MSKERNPQRSFENTLSFLSETSVPTFPAKQAHYPPKDSRQSQENWERMWDMTGRYCLADSTLQETGDYYGLTRERARKLIAKAVTDLHAASPQDVQGEHPRETLGFNKFDFTSMVFRRKMSQSHGGRSLRVAEMLQAGKSLEEIKQELQLSAVEIGHTRQTLKEWGFTVPYEIQPHTQKHKEDLASSKRRALR